MPPEFSSYYIAAFAIFGLLFGSFFNVCIYRIPRDMSVVTPRSFCTECGKTIAWFDNIPVFSYVRLRGKCRNCGAAIGFRYALVELTTAVLFVLVAWRYGLTFATFKWVLFESILLVLFWIDLEERILPDELTIGGTIIGLILALFITVPGAIGEMLFFKAKPVWQSLANAVIGAIVLAIPVWLIGALYERIRKREGLGFGDVKLLATIGVFLGLENGLTALLIGSVSGSIVGIAYVLLKRKTFSEFQLPFGSFLCFGAAVIPLFEKLK